MTLKGTCCLAGCGRPARTDGCLCFGHERRRSRGQPLEAPLRERLDPASRVLAAALEYADAPAEDDLRWELARARLLSAARRFGRSEAPADVVRNRCEPASGSKEDTWD